jgi:hypothetical protein
MELVGDTKEVVGLNGRQGRYVVSATGGERVHAFIPPLLPPHPPLDLRRLQRKLERANQALGRLDGLTRLLPDPHSPGLQFAETPLCR